MLVDLGRNDVGRVSEFGSVRVKDLMFVERYSHVMHLVSSIEGTLKHGLEAIDAFKACFPAGTLSGAPKIRAMEIIEELEPARRGVYGGSIFYADFHGNLDSCIAIRTLFLHGDAKATSRPAPASSPIPSPTPSSTSAATRPAPSSAPSSALASNNAKSHLPPPASDHKTPANQENYRT